MARRQNKLDELKADAEGLEGKIHTFAGDVSSQEDIENMVKETMDTYGKIDVLVNNAGVLDRYLSAHDMEDEVWERVMTINLDGAMKLTREVLPHMMKAESGSIINTASVGGLHGGRGGMAYVTYKHALVGMTKHTGFMYRDYGIRCNAIAPGSIDTGIALGKGDINEHVLKELMAGYQAHSILGQSSQIADVMLFLASEESSFINGTVLVADGGWTAF